MRILYIEDDPTVAEIYLMLLREIYPDTIIEHLENGLKAIHELKLKPDLYNLIISDYNLPGVSGGDIFNFVSGQMLGIPFIILSGLDCSTDPNFQNFFNSHVRNALILKPVTKDVLAEKIAWCLGGESNLLKIYQNSKSNNDERVQIRSDSFLKINSIACDIYLKLSNDKFVRIIKKDEVFSTSFIQKLILKGVTNFYVYQSELSAYGTNITNTFYGVLKSKKFKSDEALKSQITNKAIEIIKNSLIKCGFNSTILKVADEVASLQLEMIKNSPELTSYLEKYQNFSKINTEHTRLVSYIVVGILKELNWDSDATLQKMCTAALLHDITMSEELIKKLNTIDSLEDLSEEDGKLYYRHPEESAQVAKYFESIAVGVEQYVIEHHELPNGKGFPKKLNYSNIHPLSAVLHLSDLTAELLWKYNFEISEVKLELVEKRSFYLRGFYRKPYESLMNSLKHCK